MRLWKVKKRILCSLLCNADVMLLFHTFFKTKGTLSLHKEPDEQYYTPHPGQTSKGM